MTIIRGIPIAEYLASPNVSHSKLRTFEQGGPRLYHDRYLSKTSEREETSALVFGQAFETLLQRGEAALREEVLIAPHGLDGRTKEGKAFKQQAAGRTCIAADEFEAMRAMVESLSELEVARDKLEACEQQVTLTAPSHGLTLQARPDYVLLSEMCPISIDLKTTKCLNDLNATGVVKLGYHTQAALVRRVLAANGLPGAACYLLAVEKVEPYRSALLHLTPALLDAGDLWIDTYLPRLAACFERGQWPRAEPTVRDLELPRWLAQEHAA